MFVCIALFVFGVFDTKPLLDCFDNKRFLSWSSYSGNEVVSPGSTV
jgi:hypothetical protein